MPISKPETNTPIVQMRPINFVRLSQIHSLACPFRLHLFEKKKKFKHNILSFPFFASPFIFVSFLLLLRYHMHSKGSKPFSRKFRALDSI